MSLLTSGMLLLLSALLFWQGHSGHSAAARPAFYEYLLVAVAVVVLVWVLYLAVRMTVRPGEEREDHIKRLILEEESKPNE
ncbi:MAG TPA: hypothetical protein VJ085_09930 [Candidatus Acidoferrales bacterium]|nr:hypothetical protein [Candidatus Acidoferrales bacterium]